VADCLLFARPMHGQLSFLAFLLYLTLDLSNPFVAGAFNFDVDECVEAAQRQQRADATADGATHVQEKARPQRMQPPLVVRRMPAPDSPRDRRTPAPVAHALAAPPPSPTEDH
jgi:hypothetical protein